MLVPRLNKIVTLSYTIGGNAREGVDYVILEERKKVKIPAGEYFGFIKIQLINNANNILRSQDIIFTLQTTNIDKLEVGQGASAIGKSFTFTIFDDCILGGTYSGQRSRWIIHYRRHHNNQPGLRNLCAFQLEYQCFSNGRRDGFEIY